MKTDQEKATVNLMKLVKAERDRGKIVIEESPVEDHQANGMVERGIQEIEGRIRAIYLGLQERVGKVSVRERIVAFIPEYAAYLLNRLHEGSDGKVPYERVRGKKPTVVGIEFGERVHYQLKKGSKMEKMNQRWDEGVFVGINRASGEAMIATEGGIIYANSIQRMPYEERWDIKNVKDVKWAPAGGWGNSRGRS